MDKNNLSEDDKWKIYLHYYAVQLGLKHSFHIVDKTPLNPTKHNGVEIHWTVGRGKPDKEFGNIALYYLWKYMKILSFDKFNEEKIQDWYWRFENEFNHK